MSEHIPEDLALVLAALERHDPERLAAVAHAESCPACARILERGASVLAMIDSQQLPVRVDPRLKARVLASIEALDGRRAARPWEPIALAVGALLSIALVLYDGHGREGLFPQRAPMCVMWQLLGALISLAGVGLWARGWAQRASPLSIATVAMGGGLVGQLWLRVRCPTHDAELHSFAFHVTGVLFAGLIGYLLARGIKETE